MTNRLLAKLGYICLFTILIGCAVDPTSPGIQNPAYTATFQQSAGTLPANQRMQIGQRVQTTIVNRGYRGSGDITDMSNYSALPFDACAGSRCPDGSDNFITQCKNSNDGTVSCTDAGSTFNFYPDQRFAMTLAEPGLFASGVWYQTAEQKRRASRLFDRMTQIYVVAQDEVFGNAVRRNDALEEAIAGAREVAEALDRQ